MKKQSKIMIAIAAAVAVIAVAAVALALGAKGGEDSYAAHLELARQYIDELNYERAIAELQMAIELDPAGVEAYLALAEVYVAMEDYDSAVAILERGLAATRDEIIAARLEELREQAGGQSSGTGAGSGQGTAPTAEGNVEWFQEEYAGILERARSAVSVGNGLEHFLSRKQRENSIGTVAEELERYIRDLDTVEDLPESCRDPESSGFGWGDGVFYPTLAASYEYLAELYQILGDLERCLEARTQWAQLRGRLDLIEDGNHGISQDEHTTYDRYGRWMRFDEGVIAGTFGVSTYEYGEAHEGATYIRFVPFEGQDSGMELSEDFYTYDAEGRTVSWRCRRVYSDGREEIYQESYSYQEDSYSGMVTVESVELQDGEALLAPFTESRAFRFDEYGKRIRE